MMIGLSAELERQAILELARSDSPAYARLHATRANAPSILPRSHDLY